MAQRLATGTAVLYRAVDNRAELLAHVVDWVFGQITISPDIGEQGWKRGCIDAAEAIFDTISKHPGIAPLLIERVPVGPNTLALRERFLAVLLANGFPPPAAARSYALLARYTLGFAAQLRTHAPTEKVEATAVAALFHQLDAERFPATIAVADYLPMQTLHEEFRFGLELLVSGLAAHREETED
ncbi:TetR/AcrR family transcriptional regulator [Nocardia heshunensis]